MRLFPFLASDPRSNSAWWNTHTARAYPYAYTYLTQSHQNSYTRTHAHTRHTYRLARWLEFVPACTQIHISWGKNAEVFDAAGLALVKNHRPAQRWAEILLSYPYRASHLADFHLSSRDSGWLRNRFVYGRKRVWKTLESVLSHLCMKTLNGTLHSVKLKSLTVWHSYKAVASKVGCIHSHKVLQKVWLMLLSKNPGTKECKLQTFILILPCGWLWKVLEMLLVCFCLATLVFKICK